MRSQFSEKVDKYILSPALNNLVEEAKDYILSLKETDDLEWISELSHLKVPDFVDLNRSVYVVNDSVKYHNNNPELSLPRFTKLTEEQLDEYKKFLANLYHHRNNKIRWMVANQLINIASIGPIGIYGMNTCGPNTFKTVGYKLYRLVDGLNHYYTNDKLTDILELDPFLDEFVVDGNATVKPITLTQLVNAVGGENNYDLVEGRHYQQTYDDDNDIFEINPWIDGVDTPCVIHAILDLIKSNIVIAGNFNAKARENIELALNKANEYMQTLPLTTKLTEIDIIGANIKKFLSVHDQIPIDTLGDSFSNTIVNIFKDVDPELLANDIINFSKLAAKDFKERYTSNDVDQYTHFGGRNAVESGLMKVQSGVDPTYFSLAYYEVNKLGLASYVAD